MTFPRLLRGRFRNPRAPFITATSLAATVIATSGFIDVASDSISFSRPWTWWWILVSIAIAVSPLLWRGPLPPAVPLAGCYLFASVTSVQIAASSDAIMTINNVVLYPMLSCYLGWFFWPWVARLTVGSMLTLSGLAIASSGQWNVAVTWLNLALCSLFCLEAALHLRRRLDEKVETDPLTGALNRAGLDRQLPLEIKRSVRLKHPLSIVLIDLDDFKALNDRHGHAHGDATLMGLVRGLKADLGPLDIVTRMGGDEFVIIVPGLDIVKADQLAKRLQTATQTSWTYGLAEATGLETAPQLLGRADIDLYLSKSKRGVRPIDSSPPESTSATHT